MVDGIFTFSPDPLPPDLDATHDLLTKNGNAMYAVGQLSDLDTWLDSPEVILSPLIHREAVDSSNIETTTRLTLSDIYRREAGEKPGQTETERADIAEAQNYVEAITTGIQALRGGAELDRDLLCRLHELLLQGARGEQKKKILVSFARISLVLTNRERRLAERDTTLAEHRLEPLIVDCRHQL